MVAQILQMCHMEAAVQHPLRGPSIQLNSCATPLHLIDLYLWTFPVVGLSRAQQKEDLIEHLSSSIQ